MYEMDLSLFGLILVLLVFLVFLVTFICGGSGRRGWTLIIYLFILKYYVYTKTEKLRIKMDQNESSIFKTLYMLNSSCTAVEYILSSSVYARYAMTVVEVDTNLEEPTLGHRSPYPGGPIQARCQPTPTSAFFLYQNFYP